MQASGWLEIWGITYLEGLNSHGKPFAYLGLIVECMETEHVKF